MTKRIWKEGLLEMPEIRELVVRDVLIIPLVYALSVRDHPIDETSDASPNLLLPCLETLVLQLVKFRRKDRQRLEKLRDLADTKKGCAQYARVPKVVLEECTNVDRELVDLIEGTFAATVEWDGYEVQSTAKDEVSS